MFWKTAIKTYSPKAEFTADKKYPVIESPDIFYNNSQFSFVSPRQNGTAEL